MFVEFILGVFPRFRRNKTSRYDLFEVAQIVRAYFLYTFESYGFNNADDSGGILRMNDERGPIC